ncbi:hypothetical protein [Azospirillum baldaniorum]|uniref:Uncharacterized protein n=1 Tax=Azospirillum baldaniorum TaxID=1064539 RepID=A0A9P1NLP7_9PROT|nr:hypothetical protein [Azospirillum baldaniorum]CCC97345.1 protein of unknown function [Azospirillum baldaniorum]
MFQLEPARGRGDPRPRGVEVSYETIREWDLRFGRAFATTLKRPRPRPGDWDPEAADREIEIRPMLHRLVGRSALDLLERFAAKAENAIARERRTKPAQDGDEREGTEG